jgi:tetratricopeptide (TPR) repeat protein
LAHPPEVGLPEQVLDFFCKFGMLISMTKLKVLLVTLVVTIAGLGGFFGLRWYKDYFGTTVLLKAGLPPAPKDYAALHKDEVALKGVTEEFKVKYQKSFDEAVQKITEHPDSFLAWMDLAFVKNVFGDYAGARDIWIYAGELSPSQARSHQNLAFLYFDHYKDYKKAELEYLLAIEKEPAIISSYKDLAALYRFNFEGRKGESYQMLEQGFQKNRESGGVELLAQAGIWAMQDGEIDTAIAYYEEFLKIDPQDPTVLQDLAQLKAMKTKKAQ